MGWHCDGLQEEAEEAEDEEEAEEEEMEYEETGVEPTTLSIDRSAKC